MAQKNQFYVVWKGKTPGIYTSWEECSAQVNGFSGAKFKGFKTRAEAEAAFAGRRVEIASPASPASRPAARSPAPPRRAGASEPIRQSWAVDAACNPVPGKLEFRAVETASKSIIFSLGPFEDGTNNVGEFLALVQALRLCAERGLRHPIYSDSITALAWLRDKRCKTNLAHTGRNTILFTMIAEAETWLKENAYPNKVLKWRTESWGEIPADYGRK